MSFNYQDITANLMFYIEETIGSVELIYALTDSCSLNPDEIVQLTGYNKETVLKVLEDLTQLEEKE